MKSIVGDTIHLRKGAQLFERRIFMVSGNTVAAISILEQRGLSLDA